MFCIAYARSRHPNLAGITRVVCYGNGESFDTTAPDVENVYTAGSWYGLLQSTQMVLSLNEQQSIGFLYAKPLNANSSSIMLSWKCSSLADHPLAHTLCASIWSPPYWHIVWDDRLTVTREGAVSSLLGLKSEGICDSKSNWISYRSISAIQWIGLWGKSVGLHGSLFCCYVQRSEWVNMHRLPAVLCLTTLWTCIDPCPH